MPLLDAAGSRAKRAIWLGVILVLVPSGCTRDEAKTQLPSDDTDSLQVRALSDMRDAPSLSRSDQFVPPAAEFPPIPQDPVAQEKARQTRYQQQRMEFQRAYLRFGRRNILWDATVSEALEHFAKFQASPAYRESSETNGWYWNRLEEVGDDQYRAWKAARRALEAGCNDPLIQYLFARLSYGECAVEYGVAGQYWALAAEGMSQSDYPPYFKALAFIRAGDFIARQNFNRRTESNPEAERWIEQALALLPAVARDYEGKPDKSVVLYHFGALLVEAHRLLPGRSLESAHRIVAAALSRSASCRVAELLLTADSELRIAWLRRGRATADQVTADNWDLFDSRLDRADDALIAAAELEPNCPEIPHLMIFVETYLDRGRDRMEHWFERAMQLNGDDYFACLAKLEYLEPRWHGSEAEMLGFGRACLRTKNTEGRLPFILLEAHHRLARNAVPPNASISRESDYFTRPYVWKDIQAIYEPLLAKHPDSTYDKSCYARFATLTGHSELANRLFEELGTNYWRSAFRGTEYLVLREAARQGKLPQPQLYRRERRMVDPPRPE